MTNRSDTNTEKGSGFKTPLVFMASLAVLLFVVALVLFLQGGFQQAYNLQYQAKVMDGDDNPAEAGLREQRAILDEGVRWIDQEAGKVGMPIEDAKDLVVKKGL